MTLRQVPSNNMHYPQSSRVCAIWRQQAGSTMLPQSWRAFTLPTLYHPRFAVLPTCKKASRKRAVFAQLGQHAPPETILASSTSAIPGSQFLDAAAQAERCLVAHPVNPPYLIPLVEVCPAPFTTPAVVDRCTEFLRRVGQQPILVRREVPGFILNRLQFTLVAEALHLVGEGYCEPDDIDKVLKHGLAMRWAFIGPFEVAHLNATGGFQGFVDNLGDMMRTLARDAKTDYNWGPELVATIHHELVKKTPVEQIRPRQAWRDRRIMALRTHLADAADRLGE